MPFSGKRGKAEIDEKRCRAKKRVFREGTDAGKEVPVLGISRLTSCAFSVAARCAESRGLRSECHDAVDRHADGQVVSECPGRRRKFLRIRVPLRSSCRRRTCRPYRRDRRIPMYTGSTCRRHSNLGGPKVLTCSDAGRYSRDQEEGRPVAGVTARPEGSAGRRLCRGCHRRVRPR